MITDNSGNCCASSLFFEGSLREGIRFPFQRKGRPSDTRNSTSIPKGATLIRLMTALQTDESRWPTRVPRTTTSEQVVREHGKYLYMPPPLQRSRLPANACAATPDRNRYEFKGKETVKSTLFPRYKNQIAVPWACQHWLYLNLECRRSQNKKETLL